MARKVAQIPSIQDTISLSQGQGESRATPSPFANSRCQGKKERWRSTRNAVSTLGNLASVACRHDATNTHRPVQQGQVLFMNVPRKEIDKISKNRNSMIDDVYETSISFQVGAAGPSRHLSSHLPCIKIHPDGRDGLLIVRNNSVSVCREYRDGKPDARVAARTSIPKRKDIRW